MRMPGCITKFIDGLELETGPQFCIHYKLQVLLSSLLSYVIKIIDLIMLHVLSSLKSVSQKERNFIFRFMINYDSAINKTGLGGSVRCAYDW